MFWWPLVASKRYTVLPAGMSGKDGEVDAPDRIANTRRVRNEEVMSFCLKPVAKCQA